MQTGQISEWQRLTELYREMSDGELEELNDSISDLTEVAQQVLRDEIKKRRLDEHPVEGGATEMESAESQLRDSGEPARNYTWKVLLCECEDREQAWQIREVLREAGIESWLEGQGFSVAPELIATPRIQVAADQLEQAREVLSRPIPQSVIDQSKMPVEEFKPPVCPRCGAADPVLEDVNPTNSWRCESCGIEWAEPEDAGVEQRP